MLKRMGFSARRIPMNCEHESTADNWTQWKEVMELIFAGLEAAKWSDVHTGFDH